MSEITLKKIGEKVYVYFPYNYKAVQLIKTIPGQRFDAVKSCYVVPDSPATYPILSNVKDLIETYDTIEKGEATDLANLSQYSNVPCTNIEGLYPPQVECLRKLNQVGSQIIADCVGYGKTIEAISFLRDDLANRSPFLLIVPANLKVQWERQLIGKKGWLPKTTPIMRLYGQTPHPLHSDTNYIINYEILQYWMPLLEKIPFKTIIVDECAAITNKDTIRTKAVRALCKKKTALYKIFLSATPWRSKLSQFWVTLNLVSPTTFPNQAEFMNMFIKRVQVTKKIGRGRLLTQWVETGIKNGNLLSQLIQPYVTRREKTSDKPQRIPLYFEVDPNIDAKFIAKAKKQLANPLELANIYSNQQMDSFFAKSKSIVEWIKTIIDAEEKILLFAFHHDVINFIKKEFGKQCVVITGEVNMNKREEIMKQFATEADILVANWDAAGIGLDGLQYISRICAFLELPKQEYTVVQAVGRLDRGGQTKQVLAYFPLGDHSFDIAAYDSLVDTGMISNAVLGDTDIRDFATLFKDYLKGK